MDMQVDKFKFNSLAPEKGAVISGGDFKVGLQQAVKVTEAERVPVAPGNVARVENKAVEHGRAPEPKAVAYSEKDLADHKMKGYEEGYAKGYSSAKTDADDVSRKIEANLKTIDARLAQIIEANKANADKTEKEIADVVIRIARKVADTALANNPVAEVEKIIKRSFELLFNEPQLIIYVSNDIVGEVEKKIGHLASKEGFKGQVEIKGKAEIAIGGCTVEWQGGGLKVDKQDVWDEINRMCSEIF